MKTFVVPSGIGDVSWIYSKLKHIGEDMRIEVLDGWPYRTVPYLEMLPGVKEADYTTDYNYQSLCIMGELHRGKYSKWGTLKDSGFGKIPIQCNQHLEAGKPLSMWLPDLPTDYHYPLVIADADKRKAQEILRNIPHPCIGISGASYRGAKAWKTWEEKEWFGLFDFIRRSIPEMTFVLLGGEWDNLTKALSGYNISPKSRIEKIKRMFLRPNDRVIDLVGKMRLGASLEVVRSLDGYIGFSSGLGILNTVMDRPTVMLWPSHQQELSGAWADPDQLGDKYIASQYLFPEQVGSNIQSWLKTYIGA